MKTLALELPDALVRQLEALVHSGLYLNSQEAIRHALTEFLQKHSAALAERQQLDDIAWAVRETPDQ